MDFSDLKGNRLYRIPMANLGTLCTTNLVPQTTQETGKSPTGDSTKSSMSSVCPTLEPIDDGSKVTPPSFTGTENLIDVLLEVGSDDDADGSAEIQKTLSDMLTTPSRQLHHNACNKVRASSPNTPRSMTAAL